MNSTHKITFGQKNNNNEPCIMLWYFNSIHFIREMFKFFSDVILALRSYNAIEFR